MRVLLLMVVLSLISPSARIVDAAEPDIAYGPPIFCPVYDFGPIGDDLFLYYCDRFDVDCNSEPAGDFLVDNLPVVPYVNCSGDCRESTRIKDHLAGGKKRFPGFPAKVPLDYMHDPNKPSPIGVSPAKVGVGVNKDRDCHFIEFDYRDKPTWAKVIETRVNRPLAQGGQGQTDKETEGKWASYFIAVEVDKDPATEDYPVHPVMKLEPLDGAEGYAFRGRIEESLGKSVLVLIFLAKRP